MSKIPFTTLTAAAILTLSPLGPQANYLTAQEDAPDSVAQPSTTLDDPTIVAIFDNANSADIETGKLASQRGHSLEVRQFGAMLARDHQMVRQQGRDLARKLGITPIPPVGDQPARDQAALIKRLESLSGPQFDRAFLQHEVTFHQNVITAIKTTLLPAIENEELKALVMKVAPAFQAHLEMAQNLGRRLAAR